MIKKYSVWLLVCLFCLALTGQVHATSSKGIALTLKVSGDVKIRKAGSSETLPLKFGTPLDNGDWIRTGDKAFATVIFTDDKSLLKLRAGTTITIEGKRDAESNIAKRVTVEVGQLFAKVKKQRGTLEIATPTSVASVKGTEFWVIVLDDGTTFVVTIEGLIEMVNRLSGRIVEIRAGEVGEADQEGNIDVNEADPENIPEDPDPDLGGPPGGGEGDDDQGDQGGQPGGGQGGGGQLRTIEIEVQDEDGVTKRIIIEYTEPDGD